MRWADQLIKLSNFELELLQTRLAQIVERRERAEMKLAVLTAEGESETALARIDPEAARSLAAFREGLKLREAAAQREIELAMVEESGARDALGEAFETLKKEYVVQPDGGYRFDAPDRIAAFAGDHGMRVFGHTLVWYYEKPEFFQRLLGEAYRSGFRDAYAGYITAVVGRYKGRIVAWDV